MERKIMNRIVSWRAASALGLATALAVAGGIQIGSAQTTPRALPNLQNQQEEPQYRRGDNSQNGRPDLRDERRSGNPEDRLERRLTVLHTRLQISPAQERAWSAFAAALRDEAQDRGREGGRDFGERRGPPSVVERLEQREQRLADRSAQLDHVIGALRPLYASFSEEQKRTADRLMFRPAQERGFGERGFRDGRRGQDRDDRGRAPDRFEDRQDRDYR
jgi:hypothetical protein